MAHNIYFKNGKIFVRDGEVSLLSISVIAKEMELYFLTGKTNYNSYISLFEAGKRFFLGTQTAEDIADYTEFFDSLSDYYKSNPSFKTFFENHRDTSLFFAKASMSFPGVALDNSKVSLPLDTIEFQNLSFYQESLKLSKTLSGGFYDTVEFTVPVSGIYLFDCLYSTLYGGSTVDSGPNKIQLWVLRLDGQSKYYPVALGGNRVVASKEYLFMGSKHLPLYKGERVSFQISLDASVGTNLASVGDIQKSNATITLLNLI